MSDSWEVHYNESGAKENIHYVFANGERVAKIYENGSKIYYLNDHLGSSSVLVNENGEVVDRIKYRPFGAIRKGENISQYGYNSKELDDTGLLYYGARYYNPKLRRWTQPDTLLPNVYDPQSLNRYSYVLNNPLKYEDEEGHFAWVAGALITVMAVTYVAAWLVDTTTDYFVKTDNVDESIINPQEEPTFNPNQFTYTEYPEGTSTDLPVEEVEDNIKNFEDDDTTLTDLRIDRGYSFGQNRYEEQTDNYPIDWDYLDDSGCGGNARCQDSFIKWKETGNEFYRMKYVMSFRQPPKMSYVDPATHYNMYDDPGYTGFKGYDPGTKNAWWMGGTKDKK